MPSGLFYLDIDEKGLTEQLWQKVQDENLIEEYRIVYFAESAGGGTHIWAWRTPGATIEEDIQKLASRLGVSYDSHVTDLARCCFMVSEKYVKLLDPIVFEEQPSSPKLGDNRGLNEESPLTEKNENGSETCSDPQPPNLGGSNYKGIPYENIVQALLWKLGYGDAPAEGERNMALYTMSRYMRFICDFDEQKLFTILPHWGLSDHEVQSTIKSAVGSTRPAGIPSMMNEVAKQVRQRVMNQL